MTDFTQKHYEQIAAILNHHRQRAAKYWPHVSRVSVVDDIARSFADMFQADNPRFQRELFFRAVERPASTVETGREEQPNE